MEEHSSDHPGEEDDRSNLVEQQAALEAKHCFWSISESFTYRRHLQERQQVYVPQENAFPVPLKHVVVV